MSIQPLNKFNNLNNDCLDLVLQYDGVDTLIKLRLVDKKFFEAIGTIMGALHEDLKRNPNTRLARTIATLQSLDRCSLTSIILAGVMPNHRPLDQTTMKALYCMQRSNRSLDDKTLQIPTSMDLIEDQQQVLQEHLIADLQRDIDPKRAKYNFLNTDSLPDVSRQIVSQKKKYEIALLTRCALKLDNEESIGIILNGNYYIPSDNDLFLAANCGSINCLHLLLPMFANKPGSASNFLKTMEIAKKHKHLPCANLLMKAIATIYFKAIGVVALTSVIFRAMLRKH